MSDPSTILHDPSAALDRIEARVPQYARSVDPNVIATIEANAAKRAEFRAAALAFSAEHGDDPKHGFFVTGWGGERSIASIVSTTKPTTGQWKVGHRRRGWAPFKSNPLSKVMAAIRFEPLPVPGLAVSYAGGTNADWSTRIYFPATFVQDGVAYMGMQGLPVANNSEQPFGSNEFDASLWTEILGSEYMAATERLDGKSVTR